MGDFFFGSSRNEECMKFGLVSYNDPWIPWSWLWVVIPIIFAEFLLRVWKIVLGEEYVSAYFSATQKQNTTKQRFLTFMDWMWAILHPKIPTEPISHLIQCQGLVRQRSKRIHWPTNRPGVEQKLRRKKNSRNPETQQATSILSSHWEENSIFLAILWSLWAFLGMVSENVTLLNGYPPWN